MHNAQLTAWIGQVLLVHMSDVDHSHRIELTLESVHNHSPGVISIWVLMLNNLFMHGHSRQTPMDLPTRSELIP